jgi:hypothetical protein
MRVMLETEPIKFLETWDVLLESGFMFILFQVLFNSDKYIGGSFSEK